MRQDKTRKKKIKNLLSLMIKQNERLFVIAPPLVEMVDLVITDEELDFLIFMKSKIYNYKQALSASMMPEKVFLKFFEKLKRKGFIYTEYSDKGKDLYRLNAIVVGWYECMIYYLNGKPDEEKFSEKWNDYFIYFQKFNFFPLRNIQNLYLRNTLVPNQDTAIMNIGKTGRTKSKIIPINKSINPSDTKIYPTFFVNDLIEEYGNGNEIHVFPCVCRHGNQLIDSNCKYDAPVESCFAFNNLERNWSNLGYGRKIAKSEAIEILKDARDKGAIHSVIHERDDPSQPIVNICNCCWDCCGILKGYNMGALSLKYNSSFTAQLKEDAECKECGNCEKYCPTTAITLKNGRVSINSDICIGCGQCAYQCSQNNIELYANKRTVFLPILKKSEARIPV